MLPALSSSISSSKKNGVPEYRVHSKKKQIVQLKPNAYARIIISILYTIKKKILLLLYYNSCINFNSSRLFTFICSLFPIVNRLSLFIYPVKVIFSYPINPQKKLNACKKSSCVCLSVSLPYSMRCIELE